MADIRKPLSATPVRFMDRFRLFIRSKQRVIGDIHSTIDVSDSKRKHKNIHKNLNEVVIRKTEIKTTTNAA